MSKEFTPLEPLKELPEDYKFVYRIKACECKVDFDTNTMVDKILSTRTKKVDEEVIRQLRDIGKAKGINELILIDESKVLKMIKSLKAFEIIKEIFDIDVYEDNGKYFVDFISKNSAIHRIHELKNKQEYNILKEDLL